MPLKTSSGRSNSSPANNHRYGPTLPAPGGNQTGAEASPGQYVQVHYTGWLFDAEAPDNKGAKFDSSRDRGQPFEFQLGVGQVIGGWDQGFAGMKVGGERTLIIPPELGYGARAQGQIPANATLVFDVELLDFITLAELMAIQGAAPPEAAPTPPQ